jgi:hypothetical protein
VTGLVDKPVTGYLKNIEIKLYDSVENESDGWVDEKEDKPKNDPMDYFKKK